MWEMEGRSTEEIAAELGIKESAVRHTVSRARTSLRRVLSELVIDEERGLTALDMLSTTYKKAAELAAKSSKVALSLLLVVTAFLGFNSMTGREGALPTAITQDSTGVTAEAGSIESTESTESTEAASPAPSISMPAKKSSTMVSGLYIKSAKATWPGLDSEGIPTGFTVTGENGPAGSIRVNRNAPVATEEGTILATQAITSGGGPNVAFDQIVTVDGNGTKYEVEYISLGIKGVWAVAEARATSVDFERMSNGQYLMTVTISRVSTPTSELSIAVGNRGYDIVGAPKTITTRLLLNASKTQILAQAILIPESAQKAKG